MLPNRCQTPLIVALDMDNAEQALTLAQKLHPEWCRLKVGKELFVSTGPSLIEKLQGLGYEVFLDLKFHDIPNTVAQACRQATKLGVWMINVHAWGGKKMMMMAREAIEQVSHQEQSAPKLVAVTVLTSLGQHDLSELNIHTPIDQLVLSLAQLAHESGLDGLVCSAQEASKIRQIFDPSFLLVTPGIRLSSTEHHDQTRVALPADALAAGANYLVIGRPITQHPQPDLQVHNILQLIKGFAS